MAIGIEARIEPNVTRMARIPRLYPNNESGGMRQKRHRITRICHRNVGFWSNLDLNNRRIKKNHDFPGGIYGCAGAVF